ncbi:hypothetical protein HanLR1_Chr00c1931g0827551 [Helianthus annuus]|nr:hypothetical protein HanLR1_Chr00c1931g0827551 [Helianthus annuus]
MELRSIQSPVVSSIPTKGSIENRQLICNRQLISSFGTKKAVRSNAVKFKPIRFNIQASGFVVVCFSSIFQCDLLIMMSFGLNL